VATVDAMKSRLPAWRVSAMALLLAGPGIGAVPAWAATPIIGTSTAGEPLNSAHKYFTHYANGHYWVAYDTGAIGGAFYSSPDGVTWTSQGLVFAPPPNVNPNSSVNEWAVRYLGNTVIAAVYNDPTDIHYYRSGTLNGDGTVTWSGGLTPVGGADPVFNSLNILINNGRPIMWRDNSTAGGGGTLWRGSAILGPTWTKTAADAPAMTGTTNGVFSGGALFPTGGANPDDLIVLRATTAGAPSAGSHRLVAMKWNAATDTYDGAWYNVSTLAGILAENNTTEVAVNADTAAQKRFAAARDTSGNLHAVYVNRSGDMVHYKKAVGFNDSWSRVSAAINPAGNIDMVALTTLASDNFYLFYSKSDDVIYYRRFDGTSWGAESLLLDLAPLNLRRVLAPPETAVDCGVGLAFVEGAAPMTTWNIRFTMGVGSCGTLTTSQGAGTVTVAGPGSFEMTFDQLRGGGLASFFDLAEDPGRAYDLAGKPSANLHGLFHSSMVSGGIQYTTGTNSTGAKLDLLEATATRVRVRQEAFQQRVPPFTSILAGVKGIGDYSVYPERVALRWNRKTTAAVPQTDHPLEIGVRREVAPDPRDSVNLYSQTDNTFPNPGSEDFVLSQHDVAGVRTDVLAILYADWPLANNLTVAPTAVYFSWRDNPAVTPVPAGSSEDWSFLIYYKPTTFLDNTDPAVTSRSSDFRGPSPLAVLVGGPWQSASENTGGGDDFNEAEAAYPLTLDPALGLTFRIDGSAAVPRYKPFFKIRRWRSLAGPPSVTLQGTALVRDVDYRADVKPLSRGHFAQALAWHSTLQDNAAVNTPDVGGPGAVNGPTSFAAGRYGGAALFNGVGANVTFGSGSGNFDKTRGAIEFWFQPNYAHTDGTRHVLWQTFGDATHYMIFEKTAGNQLLFSINNGGTLTEVQVASTDYRWAATEWVHLRATWDATAALADQVQVLVNQVRPPHTGPVSAYNDVTMTVGTNFVGSDFSGAFPASGLIDEFHVYIGPSGPTTPAPLAEGGLTSSANEFLADPSKNFTLQLPGVNATGQGRYLYLGADSQFRGLNVGLATLGAGVAAGDLDWEYWDGTQWATMESGFSFTDTTNSFTRTGNVHWNDLFNWSTYSVKGGPDLYYVRVHLKTGSIYTTAPIEGLIKTDILLFQYCGDITAAAQEFVFAAPIPTAVELQSFTATTGDASVEVSWTTASELSNLGFHLYRSLSAEGPFDRITSSLIPGLGSSPTGANYTYRDASLSNGTTYYYQLEDVETTGRTERHGPVWATPLAGEGASAGDPGSGPGDTGSGGSDGGSGTARISYGQPEATSFRIVERGPAHVLLELLTPGFYAVPEGEGMVRLEVPGFESGSVAGAPDVPVKRALVEALVGRRVRVASVVGSEEVRFDGLRVATAKAPAIVVTGQGMVKAGLARTTRTSRPGLYPRPQARVLEVIFQGETKKARLQLAPLQHNPRTGTTVLTRRLLVRLEFAGVEKGERALGGSRGRRSPRIPPVRSRGRIAELVISEAGLQAVMYEEVRSDPRGVLSSSLRLSRRGQSVAFHLEPQRAVFGPGSVLYFVSEGPNSNPWGDAVYELEVGVPGTRMPVFSGAPSGPPTSEYQDEMEWEKDRFYQAGLLEAPDLWLWDLLVSPTTKSYPFTLSQVSPGATPARLKVWLQGASDFEADPDHHVRVSLNGQVVGEASWDAKVERVIEVEVDPGILQEGANTLSLENVGDTPASYSMVFLNRFSLTYPRRLVAEGGFLQGAWNESGTAAISGLGGAGFVLDVRDTPPRWLREVQDTGTDLSFRAEVGRKYLVVAAASVKRPLVRRLLASSLRKPRTGAEWLLVAPREFLGAAEPLVELRRSQGLRVKVVSLEEVEQEFGYGEHGPSALKEFLEHAYQSWPKPSLRYVLLLGDGSYDPKDYLKTGVKDRLSPFMVKTSYLWTASDPAYGAVNGEDLVPDVAVGRLPAGSVAQARVLVDKIVAFEAAGRTLAGRAVLIADNADLGGRFEANADEIASSVLHEREVDKVYLRDLGGGTRASIVAAFDNGPGLVSYVGHGGTAVWASENVFNNTDVPSLSAQGQQPLLLTMNCLNGFFHFPPFDSLAEAFLKAEGKGAVAAFSPSGLSVNDAAHLYHKAVLSEIESGRHARLGDAILAGQNTYANTGALPELLSIYHLFGDPALRLR